MQFLEIDALTGYSAALDALTEGQRAALVEIVFCYRFGALSATAVFGDVEPLRDVAGQVPAEIEEALTRRYGVDLESLSPGQHTRFYVDGDEPDTVLLGFNYSVVGELEEWKRYRRDPDCKQRLLIDRRCRTRWRSRSMERALGIVGQGQAGWASYYLSRERNEGSVLLARITVVTAWPTKFMKCSQTQT